MSEEDQGLDWLKPRALIKPDDQEEVPDAVSCCAKCVGWFWSETKHSYYLVHSDTPNRILVVSLSEKIVSCQKSYVVIVGTYIVIPGL